MKLSKISFYFISVLICSTLAAPVNAQVSTTFDSDLEGWMVTGDNNVTWDEVNGNPGGCLSIDDWATGDMNYFIAPPDYLGDWSSYVFLDSLSAEIYHSSNDPDDYPPDYIFRIAGPGGSAYALSGPTYQPVKDTWNRYAVSMDSLSWTIETGNWIDILSNVTSLRICAEFTVGDETVRLDNVALTSTPIYIYTPCVYDDFNGPGTGDWSFSESDGATNPGNCGNGGGYVRVDDGTGISKAYAPAKFLGDWTTLNSNGYLTIDLRIISRPTTNLGVGEFIRISGPGGVAHVDLDPADLLESNLIWKTFIYQLDAATWTLDSGTWSGLLSDVTECRITVEFYDGSETVGFDNFGRLEYSCPPIDMPVQIHDPNVNDCGYHSFVTISSVAHNPMDGKLYGVIYDTEVSGGGVYPVTGADPGIRIEGYDRPTHLIFDTDGDCYISEIYDGLIYRLEWGSSTSSLWVPEFHDGEADPVGMAFSPPEASVFVNPGDILVADKGSGTGAVDGVFVFSPDTSGAADLIYQIFPGVHDPDLIDLATGRADTFFMCDYNYNSGVYFMSNATADDINMDQNIDCMISIVYDEIEDDIYVASAATNSIHRVEPSSGDVALVADGFSHFNYCCLEINSASRRLWVADIGYGRVYEFCLGEEVTGVDDHPFDVPRSRSLKAFPNPFNPTATIRFTLKHPLHVRLDIFDVSGRRIRTLLEGQSEAGTHEIIWDGRDDHQKSSSSGVYFVRIVTPVYTETTKIVLIR